MKLKKFSLSLTATIALMLILIAPLAHAGKVDEVKKAVKDKCGKDLPEGDVLSAVLKAYDCSAGSDVTLADCTIKCLKDAGGNVVGGK